MATNSFKVFQFGPFSTFWLVLCFPPQNLGATLGRESLIFRSHLQFFRNQIIIFLRTHLALLLLCDYELEKIDGVRQLIRRHCVPTFPISRRQNPIFRCTIWHMVHEEVEYWFWCSQELYKISLFHLKCLFKTDCIIKDQQLLIS